MKLGRGIRQVGRYLKPGKAEGLQGSRCGGYWCSLTPQHPVAVLPEAPRRELFRRTVRTAVAMELVLAVQAVDGTKVYANAALQELLHRVSGGSERRWGGGGCDSSSSFAGGAYAIGQAGIYADDSEQVDELRAWRAYSSGRSSRTRQSSRS